MPGLRICNGVGLVGADGIPSVIETAHSIDDNLARSLQLIIAQVTVEYLRLFLTTVMKLQNDST